MYTFSSGAEKEQNGHNNENSPKNESLELAREGREGTSRGDTVTKLDTAVRRASFWFRPKNSNIVCWELQAEHTTNTERVSRHNFSEQC